MSLLDEAISKNSHLELPISEVVSESSDMSLNEQSAVIEPIKALEMHSESEAQEIFSKIALVLVDFDNIKVIKNGDYFSVTKLDNLQSPFVRCVKKLWHFFVNKKEKKDDNKN